MKGNRNPLEELFKRIGGARVIDLSELFNARDLDISELFGGGDGCPCPSCQAKKKVKGQFELNGEQVTFVFKLPYHDEIEELLSLRKQADWFNDSPIWTDIFAGKFERFEEISERGKKHYLYYLTLIKKALSERRHALDDADLAAINTALEDSTGKAFLPWTKKRTNSTMFTAFVEQLKGEMLECRDEEDMVEIRDRIEKLQAKIPADLLNATEAPSLKIAHDDLPEAIRMFQASKK